MRVLNLGRKSLKEVVQKLREIGLDLRRSYDSDYSDDLEAEAMPYDDDSSDDLDS
jgi:DNA-directed RNA polymerase alpha subunit